MCDNLDGPPRPTYLRQILATILVYMFRVFVSEPAWSLLYTYDLLR